MRKIEVTGGKKLRNKGEEKRRGEEERRRGKG